MSDNEQLLARLFYTSGLTETRPVEWIIFTDSEEYILDAPQKDGLIKEKLTKYGEAYVAFTDKINGIQIFNGVFVNARKKSHNTTQRRG